MSVKTDILEGINAEALAFQQAKARYENAFREFHSGVPPLAPEHFWPMADVFRKVVLKTMLHRQERVGVLAAEEFLRMAAIGESPWSVSAAVHFCLSYRHYKGLAYAGGDECRFGFDRGDDGYGDLMDAVVLLGREFNERLHAGRFYDLTEFSKAVEDLCYTSVSAGEFPFTYTDDPTGQRMSLASRLRVLILRGENYFAMSLEEAAAERVAVEAICNERNKEAVR
jgi:hypothetical protein